MKKPLLLLLFLIITTQILFSQEFSHSSDGLKSFVKNFYEVEVNGLKKTKNVKTIHNSIADIFNGSEVNVDVDGKVEIRKLSRNFILNRIENYISYEKLEVEYVVSKWHVSRIVGNSGVAEFELRYTLKEDNQIVTQGENNINLVAKYSANSWKITYLSDLGIDYLKTKGNCFCEIFSKGKEKSFATLLYPDGDQYTEELYNIKITIPFDYSAIPVSVPLELILSGKMYLRKFTFNKEDIYYWYSRTGAIYRNKEMIGNAKNQNKVVRQILLYKHKESCRILKLKKMK